MANSRVQIEVEDWVRREWMSKTLGEPFYRERVKLDAGGEFDFDAVNADGSTVAVISTSGCRTSGGKYAVGKMTKIRADILYLLMANAKRKIVLLTDKGMFDQLRKEYDAGRLPRSIEFLHADLPAELCVRLAEAQRTAADEVRPVRPEPRLSVQ